jgi:DNA-binding transcriptional LysR family regulator
MPQAQMNWESRLGRRLRLRDLHILSIVARCGSMAQGAAQLGMSQPAVSEAIAALERALDVRLLDRSPRGIEPTLYARALLKREPAVFDELKQAIREVEFLRNPTVGELRLGCAETLAAGLLPEIVERFSRRHPRVVLHIMTGLPATLEFHELRDRSVDLMLGGIFQPVEAEDVNIQVLGKDHLFVVAGEKSAWARRRKVSLAELVDERWIFYPRDNVVGAFAERIFRAHGLEPPRGSIVSHSLHMRLRLLATGRFLTTLHGAVLRGNAKRWGLKALPVDLSAHSVPVAVFTLKRRTMSPVSLRFIEEADAAARRQWGASGKMPA